MRLLEELTGSRFENGALARTSGQAPTFADFADAWVRGKGSAARPAPTEYAFLTDLQRGQLRKGKAETILAMLDELLSAP